MAKRLCSVLIDTYNHERYIEQAIVSTIEQDFPASDYEIVVVDDGSTDRTSEIVRKFAPRVRLLQKKNGGQASAFNTGIREAQGEAIAFLDGDDWFAPRKLTAIMTVLEQHPEASAAGHGYYEFHEDTGEVTIRAPLKSETVLLDRPEAAASAFRMWDFLRTSALVARKRVLEKIGPIPETLVFCADAFIAPACMVRRVHVIEEPLLHYRLHTENLSTFEGSEHDPRLRKRAEMHEALFEILEPTLLRMGVRRETARAFLYPFLTDLMRVKLRRFSGNRLNALRTEMRAFICEHPNPRLRYRLFKYVFVGGATLLLSPRQFYQMRDWYGRQNIGRFRQQLARNR